MKITIVAAGKIKEKYLTAGINEFLKRLGTFANVKIVEINEEKMKGKPISYGFDHVSNCQWRNIDETISGRFCYQQCRKCD